MFICLYVCIYVYIYIYIYKNCSKFLKRTYVAVCLVKNSSRDLEVYHIQHHSYSLRHLRQENYHINEPQGFCCA